MSTLSEINIGVVAFSLALTCVSLRVLKENRIRYMLTCSHSHVKRFSSRELPGVWGMAAI
jgi:hypothetical protein